MNHGLFFATLLFTLSACADRRPDRAEPPRVQSTETAAITAPPAATPLLRGNKMMEVNPSSRSLILRASHILAAHVQTSNPGAWTTRDDGFEERGVELTLVLDEILKGHVTQRVGDAVSLHVKHVRMGEAWTPMPGVWSNFPVDPGTPVLAFGGTTSEDAAVVLNDGGCLRLTSPLAASVDVHLAVQVDAGGLDSAAAVALATPSETKLQDLFASYLWYHFEARAMADVAELDPIVAFLGHPALSRVARTTLVMEIPTAVLGATPPADKHVSRLAVAFFHLLAAPTAADLHDNLVGTYLPNLLDVTNKSARTADQVFADHPGEKAFALSAVQAYRGAQPTQPLLTWLQR
ncbi:MAG: hypothetical protein U0441_07495 [Polyangiaceae bacterium]